MIEYGMITSRFTHHQLLDVLGVTAALTSDDVFWALDSDNMVRIYLASVELFEPDKIEAEEVLPEHLCTLMEAALDVQRAGLGNMWMPSLFIARVRRRRPCADFYSDLPEALHARFDQC